MAAAAAADSRNRRDLSPPKALVSNTIEPRNSQNNRRKRRPLWKEYLLTKSPSKANERDYSNETPERSPKLPLIGAA